MAKPQKTDSFQLKADFLPITILRLLRHEKELLETQLQQTIQKAPQFFENAPVILDVTDLEGAETLDTAQICDVLRACKMHPIAGRGLKNQTALPVLPNASQKSTSTKTPETAKRNPTKIITKAVRAGTQIYAKDCDLVILAPVNSGAEVVADGNIHIYAPLRGRALAGASGDGNARIFLTECEAELIAIAGNYWLNEKIKTSIQSLAPKKSNLLQLFLKAGELQIESL